MTNEQASELLSGRVLVATVTITMPEGITSDQLQALDIPSGTIIRNSCFSCEQPDTEIFPSDMTGVQFVRCNLDNVLLPAGNQEPEAIVDCSHRRFKRNPSDVLNRDWLIDETDAFVEPL